MDTSRICSHAHGFQTTVDTYLIAYSNPHPMANQRECEGVLTKCPNETNGVHYACANHTTYFRKGTGDNFFSYCSLSGRKVRVSQDLAFQNATNGIGAISASTSDANLNSELA